MLMCDTCYSTLTLSYILTDTDLIIHTTPHHTTCMQGIERRVLHFAQNNPDLARARDGNGRVAADIATKESKHAIQSIFLWHGRYRVIEGRPEHTSATCFVYRAVDEEDRDESNHPKRVALKLMRYKSKFLRELKARQFGFDSEYVVNVIATYPTYDATTGQSSCFLFNQLNSTPSLCTPTCCAVLYCAVLLSGLSDFTALPNSSPLRHPPRPPIRIDTIPHLPL